MSWDLIAYKPVDADDPSSAKASLGEWSEVKSWVSRQFDAQWLGDFWCGFQGEGYAVEINVGSFDTKVGDVIDSLSFEVRGSGNPLPLLTDFCKKNTLNLVDLTTGDLIDLDNPSDVGWHAFQEHRDGVLESAQARHEVDDAPANAGANHTKTEPRTIEEALALARHSGYLRDQPVANVCHTADGVGNNFMVWTEKLLFVGRASTEAMASFQSQLDDRGFFYIPDDSVKAAGPPLWFENLTKIEDYKDNPYLAVYGRDTSSIRRRYRIGFENVERKSAILDFLLAQAGAHEKIEDVSRSLLSVMVLPLCFCAGLTGLAYWLFGETTAMVVGGVSAVALLYAAFGKAPLYDHYVFQGGKEN